MSMKIDGWLPFCGVFAVVAIATGFVIGSVTDPGSGTAPSRSAPPVANGRLPAPVDALIGPIDFEDLTRSEDTTSPLAHPHPHGDQVCASGCALSRHPTQRLTKAHFADLMSAISVDPENRSALDELLYFGPQSVQRLKSLRLNDPLRTGIPQATIDELAQELSKSRVEVEIRVVADSGVLLAELPAQCIPLDIRHEFDLVEHRLPTLLASGTVKRVGVDRLWTRL